MNIKTKYYHVTKPKRLRCTLAIDVPSKAHLHKMLDFIYKECGDHAQVAEYRGKLGVSLVHRNDNYNHKIGRQLSKERAQDSIYQLLSVERYKTGVLYRFVVKVAPNENRHKTNPHEIKVTFFVQSDKEVVHIQFVDILAIKRQQ